MLTKKYPSTTRIVGIVLRSYIPNSGEEVLEPSEIFDVPITLLTVFLFAFENGYFILRKKTGRNTLNCINGKERIAKMF